MKILYDCFSCSPYYGSDEGIGWMWPYMMSRYHEVWALVRRDRRSDIERYCVEHKVNHIHFVYCDIPNWMNFYYRRLKKNKNGVLDFLLYQCLWQIPAYVTAKKLHEKFHFDLVHHVSTNDFRLLGFMYKLDIPYIIGPIGGAQETPKALSYYIRNHQKSEKLRKLLNTLMICLPGYKKAINSADKIYFSNPETRDYLLPYINNHDKCELLTEIGYDNVCIKRHNLAYKSEDTVFMWAGRMEYRKGLEFFVDVLKYLPMDKKWKVLLCGDGTEKEYIQRLCNQEIFADRVKFLGKIPYEQVQELYHEATAFVFPSLRETTGTVVVEAMAHALPVICLKQGGAALVVNEDTGFLIPAYDRQQCVSEFADAMISCIKNPENTALLGANAAKRIAEFYSWEKKCDDMEAVYQRLFR